MKIPRPIRAYRSKGPLKIQDHITQGEFKKTYEPVFYLERSSKAWEKILTSFVLNGIDSDSVVDRVNNVMRTYLLMEWDAFIHIFWLRKKTAGHGSTTIRSIGKKKMTRLVENSSPVAMAELEGSLFYRVFSKYVMDLIPNFLLSDPWESPEDYEFPFKWITPSFLVPITYYERRMFLLQKAEEKKMTYSQFIDYVINDVLSFNELIGEERYVIHNKDGDKGIYIRRVRTVT